ncbi:zinc finger FYVE domain-containing protein 9 [Schistocerca cancellata]|uniref:zinc finger FYVE domain-containing protein 9 n=1 Tax=Schistocerca cancellata TaxID=274614 RepID=UPI002117A0D7|nr:zinc finger FYVE domain-containing protein 9 [Schistocerca cancellata]
MEKFTVDLDKVLDEFEFNEDREEQLLMVGKKGFSGITSTTSEKSILQHEATPPHTEGFESISCAKTVTPPINSVQISVLRNNVLSPLIETNSWEIKGRKDSSTNSKDYVEKVTSSNKFNVSGVFSSLNEYLNAGNLNVNVTSVEGIKEGIPYEDNKHIREKESRTEINENKSETSYSKSNQQNLSSELLKHDHLYRFGEDHNHSSVHTATEKVEIIEGNTDVEKSSSVGRASEYGTLSEVVGMSESGPLPELFNVSNVNTGTELQDDVTFPGGAELLPANDEIKYKTKEEDHALNADGPEVFGSTEDFTSTVPENEHNVSEVKFNDKTLTYESVSDNSHHKASEEVISFSAIEELSDNELDLYLQELEQIYDTDIAGHESDESSEQSGERHNKKMAPETETQNESLPQQHKGSIMPDTTASNIKPDNNGDKYVEIISSVSADVCETSSTNVDCEVTVCEKAANSFVREEGQNIDQDPQNVDHLSVVSGEEKVSVNSATDSSQHFSTVNEYRTAGSILPAENNSGDQATPSLLLSVDTHTSGIENTESSHSEYPDCAPECNDSVGHVNILSASQGTASVSNVVSIECQQIKRNSLESQLGCETGVRNNSSGTVESLSALFTQMKLEDASAGVSGTTEAIMETEIDHKQARDTLDVHNDKLGTNCTLRTVEEDSDVNNSASSSSESSTPECAVVEHKATTTSTSSVTESGEKPSRPKYLHLPSKIVVEDEEENVQGLQRTPSVGSQAETPAKCSLTEESRATDVQSTVSSESDSHSSPEMSESSPVELPSSPVPQKPPANSETTHTLSPEERNLGKYPPFWVPDADAQNCMLCNVKFSVIKRRHHCRACGKVLCSKCCSLKASLDYMDNAEGRVCHPCFGILAKAFINDHVENIDTPAVSNNENSLTSSGTPLGRQPNPNNPMEYCSTIPPLEQAASAVHQPLPSVLVPVGVLKREGSSRPRSEVTKQVMFSDGIRPGGDLTELDGSSEPRIPYRRQERTSKRIGTPPGTPSTTSHRTLRALLPLDPNTKSYIPSYKGLPPLASIIKGELRLDEELDTEKLIMRLKNEDEPPVTFALNRNLFVQLKIVNLNCCVNRTCWCFSTIGMSSVGQDEIVIILECLPDESSVPRDIFTHLSTLYQEASRGRMVSELGHSVLQGSVFLGSSEYGGFIYIRPSFQCLHKLILPPAPFLIGILIHRWETPWAKVFPIRLMLRLGAEFRYYPCMLVSVRGRRPVYCEIGHTIINLLADFRNLSYTLPSVRGLVIHMEDRRTSVLLPKNRYDQVTRALNNSNDHVLAFAANFSFSADSHLVCIQSGGDESYHTQAINIHNKPRKVTGASFVVFNGALKASSNLTAKSSIVEDGLMVQITPDSIQELRSALRNMKDFSISCGPTGVEQPDEVVYIKWVQDDKNFNIGVKSLIDGRPLDGIPSIRVHNGTDYMGSSRFIRWTEVFILQSEEVSEQGSDPIDISRLTESIARATCLAVINLLDLLAQAGLTKIAVRAMIHPENVGYEAGSQGEKLPPIYMNSLDNELIPILHKAASMSQDSPAVVLELIFHIMLQ